MSLNTAVQEIVRETRELKLPRSLIVLEAQLREHGPFWFMVRRLSIKYQLVVMTEKSLKGVAADLDDMQIPPIILSGNSLAAFIAQQGETWSLTGDTSLSELCVIGYSSEALADKEPPSGIEHIILDPEVRLDYYERILCSFAAAKDHAHRHEYGVSSIQLPAKSLAAAS